MLAFTSALSSFRWNFFRIHLAFFALHALIWSVIFWAANGRNSVSFVDSLFLVYSAQTVTGLSTINLSGTTGFQQAILFWCMFTGNWTIVSWVMVLVRKHYFTRKCVHVIKKKQSTTSGSGSAGKLWHTLHGVRKDPPHVPASLVLPGGTSSEHQSAQLGQQPGPAADMAAEEPAEEPARKETLRRFDSPPAISETIQNSSPHLGTSGLPANGTIDMHYNRQPSPLQGVLDRDRTLVQRSRRATHLERHTTLLPPEADNLKVTPAGLTAIRGNSMRVPLHEKRFGGFKGPVSLVKDALRHVVPDTYDNFQRTISIQPGETYIPPFYKPVNEQEKEETTGQNIDRKDSRGSRSEIQEKASKMKLKVKEYIRTGVLWVGRNSAFDLDGLTDEQIEQVGGVEYMALDILSWLVPMYFVATQLLTFIVFVAYLDSTPRYEPVFASLIRRVPIPWFSVFQAMSAYTGGGLSLVDAGMSPFIAAYPLVIFLGWLICAGNMLLPVFLRLTVWIMYKCAPKRSSWRPALQFLLDHPRRCFLLLFPAHQSWFLIAVFLFLTAIEWAGFIVFDIGLDVVDSIPTGQRVLAGLFQSFGVRASGFAIVSLNALAPATKLLYLLMMYISAYPITMSIRATNVYEERSLGVYKPDTSSEGDEPAGEVFSKYLGWHLRRQLAFDVWWLAAAMLIICIIERAKIMDPTNDVWFNQFSVLFEIVSAYATVGLSLGIPTENFAFSGALRPGSKLVLVAVMLRGRHRELPVAIDRAILLPEEFSQSAADTEGRHIVNDDLETLSVNSPIVERPPEHLDAETAQRS